jgi:multisubunit Na+/H+ antiporter MnhE subunit
LKRLLYSLALFLGLILTPAIGLLGLMFVVGSQGVPMRMIVGLILLAVAAGLLIAALALAWLAAKGPQQPTTTIVQKIDLSGDVSLQQMTCRSCGGTLSKRSITVEAGAVFVQCEFCGAAYQLEEEPKW